MYVLCDVTFQVLDLQRALHAEPNSGEGGRGGGGNSRVFVNVPDSMHIRNNNSKVSTSVPLRGQSGKKKCQEYKKNIPTPK